MPSKNTVKNFVPESFYHIYNGGVDRKRIFEDSDDYQKFLYYLKIYLTPSDVLHQELPLLRKNLTKNNLAEDISIHAFCLMPNHFHLLLYQKSQDGITKLMRQLTTAYSMYFNKRYERIGPLFQGIYKGTRVEKPEELVLLSRYIHTHAEDRGASIRDFKWSSYPNYAKDPKYNWVTKDVILSKFQQNYPNISYEDFVQKHQNNLPTINHLTLDPS